MSDYVSYIPCDWCGDREAVSFDDEALCHDCAELRLKREQKQELINDLLEEDE